MKTSRCGPTVLTGSLLSPGPQRALRPQRQRIVDALLPTFRKSAVRVERSARPLPVPVFFAARPAAGFGLAQQPAGDQISVLRSSFPLKSTSGTLLTSRSSAASMDLPTVSGRAGPHGQRAAESARLLRRPTPRASRMLQQSRRRVVSCVAVATGPVKPPPSPAGGNGAGATGAAAPAAVKDSYNPEEYVLPSGTVSPVDRVGKQDASDVFRCPGCTEPACQGPKGCAPTQWRYEPDGYLRQILTARVYDVAVQSPLEKASKLSEALGNTVLLKREDLQPVFSFKLRGKGEGKTQPLAAPPVVPSATAAALLREAGSACGCSSVAEWRATRGSGRACFSTGLPLRSTPPRQGPCPPFALPCC